jgi:hypothetical protein
MTLEWSAYERAAIDAGDLRPDQRCWGWDRQVRRADQWVVTSSWDVWRGPGEQRLYRSSKPPDGFSLERVYLLCRAEDTPPYLLSSTERRQQQYWSGFRTFWPLKEGFGPPLDTPERPHLIEQLGRVWFPGAEPKWKGERLPCTDDALAAAWWLRQEGFDLPEDLAGIPDSLIDDVGRWLVVR